MSNEANKPSPARVLAITDALKFRLSNHEKTGDEIEIPEYECRDIIAALERLQKVERCPLWCCDICECFNSGLHDKCIHCEEGAQPVSTPTELIKCPFCGEPDFDLIGLKAHIERGQCEEFEKTERLSMSRSPNLDGLAS